MLLNHISVFESGLQRLILTAVKLVLLFKYKRWFGFNISRATSNSGIIDVGKFRLSAYSNSKSKYMLNVLDEYGFDEYDENSYIFYLAIDGFIISTIRSTYYPFEVEKFKKLDQIEGLNLSKTVEVGRLINKSSYKIYTESIIIYSALYSLLKGYNCYIGYTSAIQEKKEDAFEIPHRGPQKYYLVYGSILLNMFGPGVKKWRKIRART